MALTPTRIETAANWATSNTVLAFNEVGYASDTRVYKTGDGVTPWNKLPVSDTSLVQLSPYGNWTITGFLLESYAEGITAFAGGGQTNATQLSAEVNRITTVATAGDSVKLPVASPGLTIMVINKAAKPMQVFAATGETIDDVASATGVTQMQNSVVIYTSTVAGKWYANGLGAGYAGSFPTLSVTDAITASATQTQAAGTALTTVINRVVTVASAGNAVTLPLSQPGMVLTVINAHATNAVGVFPGVGDAINAIAANGVYSLAATKSADFYCAVAGTWHTILSA